MMRKLLYSASFFLVGITAMGNVHAAAANATSTTTNPTTAANATNEQASQVITIKTPEVRLVSTSANSAEGFMELDNTGTHSHILIAAYSPYDQETVLHKTIIKNGQQSMVQIRQLLIPAKTETTMAFGGLHVMLIGLDKPLQPGMNVPLTLEFEDGSALVVPATVVAG